MGDINITIQAATVTFCCRHLSVLEYIYSIENIFQLQQRQWPWTETENGNDADRLRLDHDRRFEIFLSGVRKIPSLRKRSVLTVVEYNNTVHFYVNLSETVAPANSQRVMIQSSSHNNIIDLVD